MARAEQFITEHLDIWTQAIKPRAAVGRGGKNGKFELYGIKKLRELILDLAVRGLLVHQDPNDEPANELLQKVSIERSKLVKEGRIKKQKLLPKSEAITTHSEIPELWSWTCISEIGEIGPRNEAADTTDASFIPMQLISTSYDGSHSQETRNWGEIKKGYTHIANGDVAIAKITPCFENSKAAVFRGLKNGFGAGTTELHVVRIFSNSISRDYVLLYLKSSQFLAVGESRMTGSAGQKRVPTNFFAYNPLPLPPFNEQLRIVAKVKELMTLCDQLEQQTEDSINTHQTLVETLLNALTNAPNHRAFASAWKRIEDHFDILFTTEHSIDQLKRTILQLAVMGKLVSQDPKNEPASNLLRKISSKRARLVSERKIKSYKQTLPPPDDEGTKRQLPEGWVWARLGEVLFNRDAERIPLSLEDRSSRKGQFDYYGASGVIDSIDDYLFDTPLLLIGEDGANLVNRSTPIAFMAYGKYWVNNHAHVLDGLNEELLKYVCLHINAISLEPYITGTAQPKMNQAKMNRIPLAIPPTEEQHRIVDKVEELMNLCEQIKIAIATSQTIQLNLTKSIANEAL